MTSPESLTLINTITTKLNKFFSEISTKNYHFESVASSRKNEADGRQKLLRKAFKMYKKKQISQIAIDLSEKEKDKLIIKSWEKLSQDQKIRFIDVPKLADKKGKKKRDNEAFRPGADD